MTYFNGNTITVKNLDSENAPAFALLFVESSESSGRELILHVRRVESGDLETATASNFVFNTGCPIIAGKHGTAQTSSMSLCLCDNTSGKTVFGPVADSWYLDGNSDNPIFAFVANDASNASNLGDGTKLVRGISSTKKQIYFGKSSSIITSGSTGTVTIWNMTTETATSETVTAKNIGSDQDSTSSFLGVCREDWSDEWIVFFEVCS